MEGTTNVNVLGLRNSLKARRPSTFNQNQPPTADHNTQSQTDHFNINEELSATMHGTMEGSKTNVIYHMEGDHESEAEDIHLSRQPNNTVDFEAGIQHSEVKCASSESESEIEM